MAEEVKEEFAEPLRPELPPTTFLALVDVFITQAYMALGGIRDSQTNNPIMELPLAKHAIDMLGVLEDKTRGNLTAPERNYLENSLYQLRMTYLRLQSQPPQGAPASEASEDSAGGAKSEANEKKGESHE